MGCSCAAERRQAALPDQPFRRWQELRQVIPDNAILGAILALKEETPTCRWCSSPGHQPADQGRHRRHRVRGLRERPRVGRFQPAHTGATELPEDFWKRHGDDLRSWSDKGRTHYEIQAQDGEEWYPNQYVYLPGEDEVELRVSRVVGDGKVVLSLVDDFRHGSHAVGHQRTQPRAELRPQRTDGSGDRLRHAAGYRTGKTLLALAAGLAQTMDQQLPRDHHDRATVSVGEDIGFLPGTEEEKMTPWMGALTDNLEVLTHNQEGGTGRQATNDLASRIKIRSMNFMRGRTFLSRYLILDEAQNLTPKQMKTLITRAGPGTKIVCLGNVEQIDTPYLTETTWPDLRGGSLQELAA